MYFLRADVWRQSALLNKVETLKNRPDAGQTLRDLATVLFLPDFTDQGFHVIQISLQRAAPCGADPVFGLGHSSFE